MVTRIQVVTRSFGLSPCDRVVSTRYLRCKEEGRRTVTIEGQPVSLVAPEDLILSKLNWAKESRSQMQLDDVRNLLRLVQNLDRAYLNRWVDRLGLAALYREVQP